jgi:hypothetical protein
MIVRMSLDFTSRLTLDAQASRDGPITVLSAAIRCRSKQ